MCRYAFHNYKQHFACFACRKSFKHPGVSSVETVETRIGQRMSAVPKPVTPACPQCDRSMHAMGLDFKAPRRLDRKQWLKVERLFHAGFAFHSCGCGGPGPRPRLLNEVGPFLAAHRRDTPGQAFLNRVPRRRLGAARVSSCG